MASSSSNAASHTSTSRATFNGTSHASTSQGTSNGASGGSTSQGDMPWHMCLELHSAILRGDWDSTNGFLGQKQGNLTARITSNSETPLHVAVGTRKSGQIVNKLVDSIPDILMPELKDSNGYTPLHVAARSGNIGAAKILVERHANLVYVQSDPPNTCLPVHVAAMYSHREMLDYLLSKTNGDRTGVNLLCTVIDAEFFDVAISLVNDIQMKNSHSIFLGLERLSYKNAAFLSGASLSFWERFIYSSIQLDTSSEVQRTHADVENPCCCPTPHCAVLKKVQAAICKGLQELVPCLKRVREIKLRNHQALELAKCLCSKIKSLNKEANTPLLVDQPMLTATSLGINEMVEVIVNTFPSAIYSRVSNTNENIFLLAVQNRCEKVYNLIVYQMSDNKYQFSDMTDSSGNSALHLAAILAPPHKLNRVSGAALQMQREIQWYKEVEKFVPIRLGQLKNQGGDTPQMIFTEAHKDLKAKGEKWMKDTATSCSIAAALIATIVFSAAITVPGGYETDSGFPIFMKSIAFRTFHISDAISLYTSSTSLLIFLSILTARYAEEDFLYALPKRLSLGLISLFVSILLMMISFSASLYLSFGHETPLFAIPMAMLASLPVTSFVLLQFPLLVEVISSTYGHGIFGKQSDSPFY